MSDSEKTTASRSSGQAVPPAGGSPDERCSCGAELFVKSQGIAGIERERASFREAHSVCRAVRMTSNPEPVRQTTLGKDATCSYCGGALWVCRGVHNVC